MDNTREAKKARIASKMRDMAKRLERDGINRFTIEDIVQVYGMELWNNAKLTTESENFSCFFDGLFAIGFDEAGQ